MPPIVALLEVDTSTGKNNPCGLRNRFNSSRTIPGSTVQLLEIVSKSNTLFRYLLLSITPVTDADSISYHSAFAIKTLNSLDINWISDQVKSQPQFYLVGSFEAINFLGLYLAIILLLMSERSE